MTKKDINSPASELIRVFQEDDREQIQRLRSEYERQGKSLFADFIAAYRDLHPTKEKAENEAKSGIVEVVNCVRADIDRVHPQRFPEVAKEIIEDERVDKAVETLFAAKSELDLIKKEDKKDLVDLDSLETHQAEVVLVALMRGIPEALDFILSYEIRGEVLLDILMKLTSKISQRFKSANLANRVKKMSKKDIRTLLKSADFSKTKWPELIYIATKINLSADFRSLHKRTKLTQRQNMDALTEIDLLAKILEEILKNPNFNNPQIARGYIEYRTKGVTANELSDFISYLAVEITRLPDPHSMN